MVKTQSEAMMTELKLTDCVYSRLENYFFCQSIDVRATYIQMGNVTKCNPLIMLDPDFGSKSIGSSNQFQSVF